MRKKHCGIGLCIINAAFQVMKAKNPNRRHRYTIDNLAEALHCSRAQVYVILRKFDEVPIDYVSGIVKFLNLGALSDADLGKLIREMYQKILENAESKE